MITLRPYQEKAIAAVKSDWKTLTDVMITAATGSGKTAIFCALLNEVLTDGKRGIIIAHRSELITQPKDRMISYFPEWDGRIGIVMADQHEPEKQIVVATVQSLSASPKRIADILSYGVIDYLICDETHHSSAQSYKKVFAALKEANPNLRHLGVTATPIRADGDGLSGVYQKESFHFGIVEGIKAGYLAPVRWLAIQTSISLAGVEKRAGDFALGQLKDVFETSNCFDLVVETYKKYATGRQAIAFTVSVDGAYQLADAFNAAGISAVACDGTSDKKVRAKALADFSRGDITVLCNVGLYTEGLDVPQASCILQVRPTQSDNLYVQMIGRALRTFPGKVDALILDFCPIDCRNIAMAGDVLGVPLRQKSLLKETVEPGEVMGGFTFDGKFNYEGDAAEIIGRQLDYLDISPWSWYRDEHGFLSLGLGKANDGIDRTLVITAPDTSGKQILWGIAKKDGEGWKSYKLGENAEFEPLSERGEEYANKWGNASLSRKTKSWRHDPPTEGQIKYAKKLGIDYKNKSKGQIAQEITHVLAIRSLR